jgi:predicted DCC family thiol-disulfide oxidoreductase YuxK
MTRMEQPENLTHMPNDRPGTIYFDAACGMCSAAARRMQRVFGPRGFAVIPLQSEEATERLGLDPLSIPGEIKLRTRDGRILGGADAFVELSRFVWWMFPIRMIAGLPPGLWLMKCVYAWIARRRHRISAACRL